jgi:hypothetical protein
MKKIITITIAGVVLSTAVLFAVESVHAATVVNSIEVQSVTGGQSTNGKDGEDGKDGAPGKNGTAGKDGSDAIGGENVSFITTKSVINGKTVIDESSASPSSAHTSILEFYVATSADENRSAVQIQTGARAEAFDEKSQQYKELQEILASIRLILMAYVNTLF